jgi:iron complex transport system substrate-binding protein
VPFPARVSGAARPQLRHLGLGGIIVLAAGFACVASAIAEPTHYPLTIRNCGEEMVFPRAPRRTVAIGQGETEILLSLGLADRIAGTALWVGPVLPQYEAANARIPRLAENDPSFEAVVGQEPDLVAVQFEWHVGPRGQVGRREQFTALGIPTYISPADCAAKDNTGTGDGLRRQPFTMELVYQEIRELAAIFDVAERGTALVAQLRQREADAAAAVATVRGQDLSVLFWFSSREVQGDAFVAGTHGAPAYILKTLGLRNVIRTPEEWPAVGWESIAAADPSVIVLGEMARRRFSSDSAVVKRRFLETDPVVSRMPAVRQHRFVVMDAQAMNPTIRTVDGIEALAQGIEAFGTGR